MELEGDLVTFGALEEAVLQPGGVLEELVEEEHLDALDLLS